VENDLVLADELLSPEGIAAVDDYGNPHYPQVCAATAFALFVKGVDLAPFLYADNKLYLSRRRQQVAMRLFARDELYPAVRKDYPYCISKTDIDERFDLYCFLPKLRPDDEDVYGSRIFGAIVARD
jgi:hypothetical protein